MQETTPRPPAGEDHWPVAAIDPEMRVADALALLRQSPGGVVPVVMPDTGDVVGLLSRPLGQTQEAPPVPRLGGMATPLGVYLTDGVSSGGAGFWGLFLSGLLLGTLGLCAQAVTLGLLHGLARDAGLAGAGVTALSPHWGAWLTQLGGWLAPGALSMLLIFTFLRLTPLAGTHAAEHQVVHCLERGAPLMPECVRRMPRVHPRCGTNLVVGFALFHVMFVAAFAAAQAENYATLDCVTLGLVAAAPVTLLFWRRLGGWVQRWLATRPATDAQINSAIFAARQVLGRRAKRAGPVRFRLGRRVWAMGLAQVMLGYFALLGPLSLLAHAFPRLGALLGL